MNKICYPFKTNGLNLIKPQGYSDEHKANDFVFSYDSRKCYGTFLVAPENVVITKLINTHNITTQTTELERGYGVLMTSTKSPSIDYLYWHCMPCFPVKEGQIVKQGQIVAQMANSGFCKSGGMVVPIAGRLKSPYPGTHIHFEARENGYFLDVLPYLDETIPITYGFMDIIRASQNIIDAINNLIKGRS
jgi:hypothetical protein